MNDEQRKEIRQQFWDDDYFDGLPNKGELLKHFINEYGKAIERQQQAEIEKLKVEKIRAYDNGVEDGRKLNTNPKPAKTLTDEEIWQITEDFWKRDWTTLDVGFARAILKKAQNK